MRKPEDLAGGPRQWRRRDAVATEMGHVESSLKVCREPGSPELLPGEQCDSLCCVRSFHFSLFLPKAGRSMAADCHHLSEVALLRGSGSVPLGL